MSVAPVVVKQATLTVAMTRGRGQRHLPAFAVAARLPARGTGPGRHWSRALCAEWPGHRRPGVRGSPAGGLGAGQLVSAWRLPVRPELDSRFRVMRTQCGPRALRLPRCAVT